MDVLEAIRSRRSIGKLSGPVSDDTIRELIELATWAPNHHLTEPWRFTVVAGETRDALAQLWGRLAADYQGLHGPAREESIRREAGKLTRAPVLVVASTRVDDDPETAEEDFAATAAAVQNFLLAAHAKGLGTMWRTGKMIRQPQIKQFLGLEPTDKIVATIYLGVPAMKPPAGRAREVDGVVRWDAVREKERLTVT